MQFMPQAHPLPPFPAVWYSIMDLWVGVVTKNNNNSTPTLSMTKAEYRTCSETSQDIHWVEQLVDELYPVLSIKCKPVNLI